MRVKEVIKRQGFTLEDIAKAMKTSRSAVSQIVNGNPTVGKLEEIAKIIGVSRGEFFLDEMPKQEGSAFACPHCGHSVSLGLLPTGVSVSVGIKSDEESA